MPVPHTRLFLAAPLLLAACTDKPAQTGNVEAPVVEAPTNEISSAAGTPPVANSVTKGTARRAEPSEHAIPAAFQGRWGLVAGDCGPDAAIAKGLVVIDGEKLRFYESVGTPAVVTWPAPNRLEGRFSFIGEGMEWSKDMTLLLQDSDTLVRTEKDPVARYSYTRCKT